MDYNNYSGENRQIIRNPGQTMAMVSMILGLASIFTIFTIYIPIVCGSLAIVLAILSKGYGKKMLVTAKIGVGTAIGEMVLIIAVVGSLITLFFSLSGSSLVDFGRRMDQQFEQQTGQELKDILGQSYEDIMKEYSDMMGR